MPSTFDTVSLLLLEFEVRCSLKTLVSTNETLVLSGNPGSKQMYLLSNIRAAILESFRGGAPTSDWDASSQSLSITFLKSTAPNFIVPAKEAKGNQESGSCYSFLLCFLRFLCTNVICGGSKGEHTNYSTLRSEQ